MDTISSTTGVAVVNRIALSALASSSTALRRRYHLSRFFVAASASQENASSPEVAAAEAPPALLRSSALETPSSSLISYANIEKAFKGEALSTPDHYGILGLAPAASYPEVETAFRKRCETVLQQGLSEEEIRKRLRALKASYDVLSSEEERRLYDWSLLRLTCPENVYAWPFEADITQRECAPGPPQPPKDEEGIRKVRNFFIGWFVLSVVLNLLLK